MRQTSKPQNNKPKIGSNRILTILSLFIRHIFDLHGPQGFASKTENTIHSIVALTSPQFGSLFTLLRLWAGQIAHSDTFVG